MAVIEKLEAVLKESTLTFEEQRAFSLGLGYLSIEEQDDFVKIVEENHELIYPLYINFKAKLRAIKGTEKEWGEVVENELKEFEQLLGENK
jgi:hypothetical protein